MAANSMSIIWDIGNIAIKIKIPRTWMLGIFVPKSLRFAH
jgi:hypothetical protein